SFVRFCILAVCIVPASASAITVTSRSVLADPFTNTLYFSVTFSGVPDFHTVDGVGRQKDEFQFFVRYGTADPPLLPSSHPQALVRSGEVHTTNQLTVVDAQPFGQGPGGWGPIRGTTPYSLTGQTVTFSMPWSMLGDADGHFQYVLLVVNFGATTYMQPGVSEFGSVPAATTRWSRVKRLSR